MKKFIRQEAHEKAEEIMIKVSLFILATAILCVCVCVCVLEREGVEM